jgi:hypothetical protein
MMPGTRLSQAFSKKVLGNLLSKDKARLFTITTLEQNKGTQSGPSAALASFASVLKAETPRSRDQLLRGLLSATDSGHGPSIRDGERITSSWIEFEHP